MGVRVIRACPEAQGQGYYGACFKCTLPIEFCNKVNLTEFREDRKARIRQRNAEMKELVKNGANIKDLSRVTKLSKVTVRQIVNGLKDYA